MGSSVSGSLRHWHASENLTGAGESSKITHSHYCWQEALVPSPTDLSIGAYEYSPDILIDFSPNKWSRRVNQSNYIFVSLGSLVISLLCIATQFNSVARKLTTTGRDSWTKTRIIRKKSVKWIVLGRASQMVGTTVRMTLRQGIVHVFKE